MALRWASFVAAWLGKAQHRTVPPSKAKQGFFHNGGRMSVTAVDEVNGAIPVTGKRFKVAEKGGLAIVECILTGVSPLLLNAMDEATLLGLWDKSDKPAKTAAKPTPREYADSKVYRLPDGRACVPAKNLYAAFIAAGQFVRLDGKRQVSTKTGTNLPGMMLLVSTELPILLPGTEAAAPHEVDIQQGKNPNGGEAVCIIRPRFDEWELHAEVEVDQKVMPLQMARDLVEMAGRRMGLGDYRPQKRGTFGRFCVNRWQVK